MSRKLSIFNRVLSAIPIAAALFSSGCSRDLLPARITSGAEFATIVRLPGGSVNRYARPGDETEFTWNAKVEFRLREGQDGVLLLRVYAQVPIWGKAKLSPDGKGIDQEYKYEYGDHAFALESDGHLRARRATEAEWTASQVVKRLEWRLGQSEWVEKGQVVPNGAAMDDGGAFAFEGKRYPYHDYTGRRFILSPGHRRVGVFSIKIGAGKVDFFHNAAYTYFLDIFDLASAKLISSVEGDVGQHNISYVEALEEPSWVTDRYFYMPLSEKHDELLMFDFGAAH